MIGRGICEKYQSRDEKFPEPIGKGNLVSKRYFSQIPRKITKIKIPQEVYNN
jgi:hypothetical protein